MDRTTYRERELRRFEAARVRGESKPFDAKCLHAACAADRRYSPTVETATLPVFESVLPAVAQPLPHTPYAGSAWFRRLLARRIRTPYIEDHP